MYRLTAQTLIEASQRQLFVERRKYAGTTALNMNTLHFSFFNCSYKGSPRPCSFINEIRMSKRRVLFHSRHKSATYQPIHPHRARNAVRSNVAVPNLYIFFFQNGSGFAPCTVGVIDRKVFHDFYFFQLP